MRAVLMSSFRGKTENRRDRENREGYAQRRKKKKKKGHSETVMSLYLFTEMPLSFFHFSSCPWAVPKERQKQDALDSITAQIENIKLTGMTRKYCLLKILLERGENTGSFGEIWQNSRGVLEYFP